MDSLLECPICLDKFQNPVIVRCGHTFCRGCLSASVQTHGLRCPTCRSDIQRENQWVCNFAAKQMIELVLAEQARLERLETPRVNSSDLHAALKSVWNSLSIQGQTGLRSMSLKEARKWLLDQMKKPDVRILMDRARTADELLTDVEAQLIVRELWIHLDGDTQQKVSGLDMDDLCMWVVLQLYFDAVTVTPVLQSIRREAARNLSVFPITDFHALEAVDHPDSTSGDDNDDGSVVVQLPEPLYCASGIMCGDGSDDHRASTLHPCRWGASCRGLREFIKRPVVENSSCYHHVRSFSHPPPLDAPPCKKATLEGGCPNKTPMHRAMYVHACRFGAECRFVQRNDRAHVQLYVHPSVTRSVLRPCARGKQCVIESVDHLAECSHPCLTENCADQSPDHRFNYSHSSGCIGSVM